MSIFTGAANSGAVNPILGEVTYPVTYSGNVAANSFTGFAGVITLSAVTSFSAPFSGVVGAFAGTLSFNVAPNSNSTTLSASPFGVLLTLPSNIGPVGHYGYISNSTINIPASGTPVTGVFSIQFDAGNFFNTIINLSANSTNIVYTNLTNQIDNPLFSTGLVENGSTARGLSSYNTFFRTQGRHIRLVQGTGV